MMYKQIKVFIDNARRYISNATPLLVDEEDKKVFKIMEANLKTLESTYLEAVDLARKLIALGF